MSRHRPAAHPIMRISLLTPEYPGCGPSYGVGRYVESLAHGLSGSQHVLVLVAADNGFFTLEPGNRPRYHGTVPRRLSLRWPVAARLAMIHHRRFAGELIEHSNWGALGAALPADVAQVCRLSSPLQALGGSRLRRLARSLLSWAEHRAVARADVVIADSTAMAARARVEYGRESVVVHHGLDLPPAPLAPVAGRRVLWVGRLEERKGIDVLAAAWPLVAARVPDAELHIVGQDVDGWSGRVATLVRVRHHGWLAGPELAAMRQACGTVVMPSRFESFGLAVLEAWSAGQCVVASDGGALPEVVADAGWCPKAGDPAGLADALVVALTDEAARNHHHAAARGRLPLFGVRPFIAGTERAYDLALAHHQGSRRR